MCWIDDKSNHTLIKEILKLLHNSAPKYLVIGFFVNLEPEKIR